MNVPDIDEVREKEQRLKKALEDSGYEAAVIGRADNFAWLTGGGDSRVISSSEIGFTYILYSAEKKYAFSLIADIYKVMDEELEGLGYIPVILKWFDKTKEQAVAEKIRGMRTVSDIFIEGADCNPDFFYNLHYPFTKQEIKKCRLLGKMTEEIITNTALKIRPGMTEHQVAGILAGMYAECDISISVMIVGSDERISKYRHCMPSPKHIEKIVLLSPAVRKWGLHANVARMVCFGNIPDDICCKYSAVCDIEAEAISMCTPGTRFSDILERQKKLYDHLGYTDEWHNHFQGGVTGYVVSDPTLCMKETNKVQPYQPYDWFITITGTKGEELSINYDGNIEVLSVNGIWPSKNYTKNGITIKLPEILQA